MRFRRGALESWFDTGAQAVRLDRAAGVWARRLWPGAIPAEVNPRFAGYCREVSRQTFLDALALVARAHWVNPLVTGAAAESKLRQLEVASAVGFRVPETVITNDARPVRDLWRRHRRIVTKLLVPLTQSMQPQGDTVFTNEVRPGDLADLAGLRHAPQIFQPRVERRRDLRVVAVGRRIFAGAIAAPRDGVDWRRLSAAGGAWGPHRLTPAVERRVRTMMARLGLVFGAFDFLDDGRPEPVFLELNPAGEWGWLERDLGFPIAAAIADELVGRRAAA